MYGEQGLGFRVYGEQGLGFRVYGEQGLEFRVYGEQGLAPRMVAIITHEDHVLVGARRTDCFSYLNKHPPTSLVYIVRSPNPIR
jgi:hypothetical protein